MNFRRGGRDGVRFINKKSIMIAMKGKKGIVMSLMIIIGLIILALMFFAYAIRSQKMESMAPKVEGTSAVQTYVETCIDAVSQYAVYKTGKRGGSLSLSPVFFSAPFLDTNYAFNGARTFASEDEVRTEIETFVNENLKNCTAGFRGFGLQGVSVKEGYANTSIIFGTKNMIVTVDYPLEISFQDRKVSLDKFQRDLPVALKKVHSQTEGFISGFDRRYNLTYLRSMNANVYISPSQDSDLFVLENLDSRVFSENYLFVYAVR